MCGHRAHDEVRHRRKRNTPFTPAVHTYYAPRAGLAALGIEPVVAPGESSVVLRSYKLPVDMTYPKLHDALKAQGFVNYAGQGDLAKTLFRISTLGQLTAADINRLLKCIAQLA